MIYKEKQKMPSLLHEYIKASEMNYLYPFGTLPSNNFFRKIQPNPYYLSNTLRNLKLEIEDPSI